MWWKSRQPSRRTCRTLCALREMRGKSASAFASMSTARNVAVCGLAFYFVFAAFGPAAGLAPAGSLRGMRGSRRRQFINLF